MNKPSAPTEARLLDAQAMRTLKEVATEFAVFKSAAGGKADSKSDPASMLTSMVAEAVDRPQADVTRTDKTQQRADAFAAHIVWLSEAPLFPGRAYLLKAAGQTVGAMVTELKYRLDGGTLEHLAAKELHRDEVAFVNLATVEPIGFTPYKENRVAGGFVLIDRHSNATIAAGLIRFALRRAANTYLQSFEVTKAARARLNGQKPVLLWFTGLSGAGKSTIANSLEQKLHALGKRTFVLDGDNVRHGLNRDLGFTEVDRVENIRRVAEVAKLFVEAGLIVIVSFISPFRAEREMARGLMASDEFIEIFVDTPLEICEQRDPKGLYRKARRGELRNFTGLDSPYERPSNPELLLDALNNSATDLADRVIHFMQQRGGPLPCTTDGQQKNRASVRNAEYTPGSRLPVRVALFVPSLGGGGAERVMVTLANALAERRFAVDLVLWTETGPLRNLLSEKVQVVAFGTCNPARLVFRLARFLKTAKPEVVISALFVGNIIVALAKAASRSRTHLILTEHVAIGTYLRNEPRLVRRLCVPPLMRLTYVVAQNIVAVSRGAAQSLVAVLGKNTSKRITVIYNPIDLARIDAMAAADDKIVSWNVPTIINVGRLTEQKDQQTLIQAFAKVRSHRPCRLVILGEGEKRKTLAASAHKLGVGADVLMPGFIANPYSWMRKSAVFVLSSKFEGLPTVLIEAMQCGVPVISADCPSGPAEILQHGQWGKLFVPGDVDALACAIDEALDGKLAADVRQRAADFSIDTAVSQYVAMFP